MITRLATYTIQDGKVDLAQQFVQTFVQQVATHEDGTLMYRAFQKEEDPGEFVHIMTFRDEKAEEWHRQTEYVQQFVDQLYPICEREPVFTTLNEIK